MKQILQELKNACYKDSIHIPIKCSITNCNQEASFFLCNETNEDDVYLCSDCGDKLINDDGYHCFIDPETKEIREIETGVYCCSEDCPICNL